MLVRVFHDNIQRDYKLEGISTFSIGSAKTDTVCVEGSDLKKAHVWLSREKGYWFLTCNGEVYFDRKKVTAQEPETTGIYLVSAAQKLAFLCIDDAKSQKQIFDLSGKNEVLIGRIDENHIVIPSSLVTKQHAKIVKERDGYHIQDSTSTNGTYLNGVRIREQRLRLDDVITIGGTTMVYRNNTIEITSAPGEVQFKTEEKPKENLTTDVVFERSPRLKLEVPKENVEIEAPPAAARKPEMNFVSTFLPTIASVGIALLMTFVMGNPMMMIYTLPMTLVGVITSLLNHKKQKKNYTTQTDTRLRKYAEYLDNTVKKIEQNLLEQKHALLAADPDVNACFQIANSLNGRLWARRPLDEDFLSVRLGSGAVAPSFTISIPKESLSLEEDELRRRPGEIYRKYQRLEDAPVVCDILNNQVCGVVGSTADTRMLLKNMVAQISVHHCYTEVKTVIVYDDHDHEQLKWMENLPHAWDDEKQYRFVASTKSDAENLFNNFAEALKSRELEDTEERSFGNATVRLPYYLFVVLQPSYLGRNHPITEYLLRKKNLGVGVIMAVESVTQLPKECNLIIEVKKNSGEFYLRNNASFKRAFTVDNARQDEFERFSENMRHVVCNEGIAKNAIPKKYNFYEMLGINSAEELNVGTLWAQSNVIKSMAAPLGIGEGKEILLDLHEKMHGPHGLVAGTTGSGKSELLQSYILSAALRFHPYEIGFVIIDFKGGGMANQFEKLPHLMGAITNIDGKAINRSLASIKAELMKRQRLFAEQGVNSIDKYIEKFKSGKTNQALPHLIIVVDEFAELKAEQPEFMKELISAARIGRSLGVHLILATQKPAGQVSDQIWSNSRFKICLKVATREDSNEVLKTPAAASIKEPGRAYLQVGNNEVFDLFQSGYSGCKAAEGAPQTQLEAVIARICKHCEDNHIQKLMPICCDPLPEVIVCPERGTADSFGDVMLGVLDAPDSQYQGITTINVAKGNALAVGTTQTGKTNLIQSIICQFARAYTPEDINFYIIDMGAMTLRMFEPLCHVGGVVAGPDQEKLKNLFKLLYSELEHRKDIFSKFGVGSFSAYREDGEEKLAQIVVFLDNLGVFKDVFSDEYEDMLVKLLREGLTYGISFVITNSQTNGISYKYLSAIGTRVVFSCNDSSEYAFVLDRCRMEPDNVPGRALISVDKNIYEVQTFLAFEGESEVARAAAVRAFVQEINAEHPGMRARSIPSVPKHLDRAYLAENYANVQISEELPFAIDYGTVDCVRINASTQFILALAGKNSTEKERFVRALLEDLRKRYFKRPVELYIVDDFARKLNSYKDEAFLKKYSTATGALSEVLEEVRSTLETRLKKLESGELESLAKESWVVVLINNKRALEAMADDSAAQETFNEIQKKYAAMKVIFLLADVDDVSIRTSAPPILRKVRDDKKVLYFGALKEIKLIDAYGASTRTVGELSSSDDAYLFVGEDIRRVKTVQEV